MNKNSISLLRLAPAIALLLVAYPFFGIAAPINYGDFVGSSVMFLDVTETANTPGDNEPLYSGPIINGNVLDFNPQGFIASASGSSTDITDGQLNFMLSGLAGSAITGITFSERGDYTLFGNGTLNSSILYALSIGSISVLEVDGVPLATPLALAGVNASGGDNLSNGTDAGSPWSLSLTYDVNAALNGAGVSYVNGATRLDIAVDNILGAISERESLVLITKKDFRIEITGEAPVVPVPGALVLMISGLTGLAGMARLKHRR